MRINLLFYSSFGHMYEMMKAAKEGVEKVTGVEGRLLRIPELLSDEILEKTGAMEAQKAFSHIPVAKPDDLRDGEGLILGISTRYGQMNGQMKSFFDSTGQLWLEGALVGKIGSAMSSTATQHGGQENALLSAHSMLLHHGMLIAGLPYAFQGQMGVDEIKGGSPYGATTIAGGSGERMPGKVELDAARYQGEYVAKTAAKLFSAG